MSMSVQAAEAPVEAPSTGAPAFLGNFLQHLARGLEPLLGAPIRLEPHESVTEAADALRLRLPSRGVALAARRPPDVEDFALCVMEPMVARSLLARIPGTDSEPLAEAPRSNDAFTETERQALLVAAARMGEIFASVLRADTRAATTWERAVFLLEDSTWQGAHDPVTAPAYCYAGVKLTVGTEAGDVQFLLSAAMAGKMEALLPAAPAEGRAAATAPAEAVVSAPAEDLAAGDQPDAEDPAGEEHPHPVVPKPLIVCVGSEPMVARVQEALPLAEVQSADGTAGLVGRIEAGERPALVLVEVPAGSEKLLDHLAGLARHPALSGRRLVVMLGNPVKSVVLHCGRLGLVNVIPAQADADLLKRRLTPVLSG